VSCLANDDLSLLAPVDQDAYWLRRGVGFVGRAIVFALSVAAVRAPLLGLAPDKAPLSVILVGILVVSSALWLNHLGHSRIGAQVLALALPALAGGLAISTGRGFRDPAVLILPASVVLCGLLLDRRTLAVTTAVTLAAAVAVLVADARGIFARPDQVGDVVGDVIDTLLILGVTSVGVGIVAGRLRRSVERLRDQEAALRASEMRYRGLVDLAADAIVVGTAEGITEANRRATELTGYARGELVGRPLGLLFSLADRVDVPLPHEALAGDETGVVERALTRKDGVEIPIEMSSRRMPDGTYQSIFRDVSERRRAEAQRLSLEARLRQAQKMEAVGRLAGGIAHDFNNLLTAMTGSLTLALRAVPDSSPARRWLTEIDKSAWRAAALTRHLLAFSRQQVIEPKVADLRALVEGVGSLVARTIGEDVTLRVCVGDEPVRVEVDHGQMEQIILNLVTNARDAMPEGGTLTLAAGWADSAEAARHAGPRGGKVAVLAVTDTGHGMSDAVRARVFEPFFTTKPSGSGTGLGLAIVYGAVEQNGGAIDVLSSTGRGTTFRIFLPEARAEATAPSLCDSQEAQRGTETVLLVEDEEAVREVAARQLESLGYRVFACASAREALAVAAGHPGALDLLFTDVVMPGMNGRELAARLSETRRHLRVLYTTGYGEDVIARHGVLEEGVLILEKPYSLSDLARQVRRALVPRGLPDSLPA
jgi:two-component system, cell cycle sensor histidine kinase and response regulator CckA